MKFLYLLLSIAFTTVSTIIGMQRHQPSPYLLSQRIENPAIRQRTKKNDTPKATPGIQQAPTLQMNKGTGSSGSSETDTDQETSNDPLLCGLPVVAACGWCLAISTKLMLDQLYS